MNKQINGRVEADPLRDARVLGPIFGTALKPLRKLFEYKITGSVLKPDFKPVYVPEFFMLLFRPFHTLKSLLPDSSAKPPAQDAK